MRRIAGKSCNTVTQKSDDETSFADLVPGVRKLDHDRVLSYRDRTKNKLEAVSQPREPMPDYSYIGHRQLIRLQDSNYSSGITKKLQRKIRQGKIPIDDQLDLHGYTQTQAMTELNRFLNHALSSSFKMLIVIHGKGQGSAGKAVLKPMVQHWLAQQESVLAWCPAQANHGGSGASYMYLRVK